MQKIFNFKNNLRLFKPLQSVLDIENFCYLVFINFVVCLVGFIRFIKKEHDENLLMETCDED